REALAPTVPGLDDAGQAEGPRLRRGLHHEGRAGVQLADEIHAHIGRSGALGLLEEDQVLGGRRATAAVLLRPVDARVPGVVEHALPARVPRTARRPVLTVRPGSEPGEHVTEPLAEIGPELLFFGRVAEIHRAGSVSDALS